MMRAFIFGLLALLAGPAAAAQILVYGDLARDRDAAPGQTYEEVVAIHNPTEEPQQARLYLRDYAFAADGTNAYDEPGSRPRSNAAWVTFAPPVLTVPPGETIPVVVTVAVPADADGGSHWSMLMVEGIPPTSAESTLRPASGTGEVRFEVNERVRYGIQLASHLPAGTAQAEVLAVELQSRPDGSRVLAADVTNTGDRMFTGPVYIDVFDASGAAQGRIDGSSARVYPGTSFRHRVDLSGLDPGVYEALFVIDGGEQGLFGAQYTLEL